MTAPERSFSFQDQMTMSEGVCGKKEIEQIILESFPNAVKVERADVSEDKNGTDYWVTTQSGQKFSVDIKVREKDYSKGHPEKDDLALEIWSVVNQKVGWTRDIEKRTDYILWIWQDTGRWMLIPFPLLCKVFSDNWQKWMKTFFAPFQTSHKNRSQWKSQCVFVPRRLLWLTIYSSFGGAPVKPPVRQLNLQPDLNEGIERAKQAKYHNPRGKP